ncbi:MAG: preprotein translocase YidC, partial [Planctomycetes bacterium]|nr:preprotein translocase YidC [Planctomycetota bacterium]
MEKRFALFLVLSALILFTHLTIRSLFFPPPPPVAVNEAEKAPADDQKSDGSAAPKEPSEDGAAPEAEPAEAEPKVAEEPEVAAPSEDGIEPELATLGSLAADSPFKLLVTLNNRGAAIERIELNERTSSGRFRFRDLDRSGGYLGHLEPMDEPEGGCRIRVVGPGTPA